MGRRALWTLPQFHVSQDMSIPAVSSTPMTECAAKLRLQSAFEALRLRRMSPSQVLHAPKI